MDAVKVVSKDNSRDFESKCNALAREGYLMVSCYCGFFNPNLSSDYAPGPIWCAIFAMPRYIQFPSQQG